LDQQAFPEGRREKAPGNKKRPTLNAGRGGKTDGREKTIFWKRQGKREEKVFGSRAVTLGVASRVLGGICVRYAYVVGEEQGVVGGGFMIGVLWNLAGVLVCWKNPVTPVRFAGEVSQFEPGKMVRGCWKLMSDGHLQNAKKKE